MNSQYQLSICLKQCKSLISVNVLGETVANPYIELDVHTHGLLQQTVFVNFTLYLEGRNVTEPRLTEMTCILGNLRSMKVICLY